MGFGAFDDCPAVRVDKREVEQGRGDGRPT